MELASRKLNQATANTEIWNVQVYYLGTKVKLKKAVEINLKISY